MKPECAYLLALWDITAKGLRCQDGSEYFTHLIEDTSNAVVGFSGTVMGSCSIGENQGVPYWRWRAQAVQSTVRAIFFE